MSQPQIFLTTLKQTSIISYCESEPVAYSVLATFVLGTVVFILNKTTGEYSWVDRIWSLLPIFYAIHFLCHQKHCQNLEISFRQWIMLMFVSAWGLRLTYNYWRKGGYSKGGEDYRWEYIRKNYHWVLVELLNFVFISYYQIFLILWFSSPIVAARQGEISVYDMILFAAWVCLYAGEVISDQQQWDFQTMKYKLLEIYGISNVKNLEKPFCNGFNTSGLFQYSRHPNFFCEISMWYVYFFMSVSSVGLNWTGLGCILLNLLFLGSTNLTEQISCEKYPAYKEYQQTTSMLIPWLPTKIKAKKN